MNTILITGGLGYIGGRLATYLKETEPSSRIIIADQKINKPLPDWMQGFKFVPIDVTNEKSLKRSLKDVDIIIHLAALNEIDSLKNPELALEINTNGTYKLLEQAKINKVNRFIYFSTFHVYGTPSVLTITEETPTMPFHPYAITHRAAEDMVVYFGRYHNIKGLILRLSNGYGYPMDKNVTRWSLVFNDLCRQAVTTGKMVLKSSGKQYRDFIALSDVARAVHHFIFDMPDKWGDGLYNLGGNRSLSILEVAQKIARVYKSRYKKNVTIETHPQVNEQQKTNRFKVSIAKLLSTGFRLQGHINEEIIRTLEVCEDFAR